MAKLEYVIAPGDGVALLEGGSGPDNTQGGWCSCGYTTTGWPNAEVASERLAQHAKEHETGEPMEELVAFRERLGLVPDGRQKAVFPPNATPVTFNKVEAPVGDADTEDVEEG